MDKLKIKLKSPFTPVFLKLYHIVIFVLKDSIIIILHFYKVDKIIIRI